jgi:hypothetical protein
VDWRSSSDRRLILALALVFFGVWVLASGCGMHAVRPAEREHLADRIMLFDDDPHEIVSDDHVLSNREGSAGGRGTSGGGCGCN